MARKDDLTTRVSAVGTRRAARDIGGVSKSVGGLGKQVKKANRDTGRGAKVMTRYSRSVLGLRTQIGGLGLSLAAFGTATLLKQSLSAASDLNEEISKIKVVFGNNANAILNWSRSSATAASRRSRRPRSAAGWSAKGSP